MSRWHFATVAVLLTVLTLVQGCGAKSTSRVEPQASWSAKDAFAETATASIPYTEYRLPAGVRVQCSTDRYAAYARSTWKAYPSSILGVIDLETGSAHDLLVRPVSSGEKFDSFSPVLNDRWIAWEEASPNEGADPWNAQWRLYVAALEDSATRLGAPRLVAEGRTSLYLRPFYTFRGDRLVWTSNRITRGMQEVAESWGEIRELDLNTGKERTVVRRPETVWALSSTGSRLIAYLIPADVNARHSVVTLDATSGNELAVTPLEAGMRGAHFPALSEARVFVATFASEGREQPDLWMLDGAGRPRCVAVGSSDPVVVGGLVAFERHPVSTLPVTPVSPSIALFEPAAGHWSELTSSSGVGWQTALRSSPTSQTLVITREETPPDVAPEKGTTLVRLYRFRR